MTVSKYVSMVLRSPNPVEQLETVILLIQFDKRQTFIKQTLCWATQTAVYYPQRKYTELIKYLLLESEFDNLITPKDVGDAIKTAVRGKYCPLSESLRAVKNRIQESY